MRKGWKRVHRLVVLPDYQGIGIGIKFINEVSKHYTDFNMNLTTTTPSLVMGLRISKYWKLVRFGRTKNTLNDRLHKLYGNKKREDNGLGSSDNRITYSFNFIK